MQSGTGVYYQALPAVGPDGKNVMKLIPVKKVNGHFVTTHALPSKNVCLPSQMHPVPSPQSRIPTLQPTADGRFILKSPLQMNTVFNLVKSQQQGPNVLLRTSDRQVPLITNNKLQSPVPSNNKAVIITSRTQLPNTVNPSASQSGHSLQIPSNVTDKTLPDSTLPPLIKNNSHPTNGPNTLKGLPVVLCVSPVSSLKLNQQVQYPAKPSKLPQTQSQTSTVSIVKNSNEYPRSDRGGTSPIKWVVEERVGSSAPYIIPVSTPSISSNILKAVNSLESAGLQKQVAKGTVSDDSKMHPIKSNQSSTTALHTVTSNSSQNQVAKTPAVDIKKPSYIIDLCDDDDDEGGLTCASSESIYKPSDTVSENDDDSNVIFVSYIPPKSSEAETSREIPITTSCVKGTKNLILEPQCMETGRDLNSTSSAEMDMNKCEAVDVNRPALKANEELSEKLEVVCIQQTNGTEKLLEEMVPDNIHQPVSDSELRRTFGITSYLSVSLQKIDVSKDLQVQDDQAKATKRLINKRTLDGIRRLIYDSKVEKKITQLIQTQVPTSVKTGKRKRLEENKEKSDSDTILLINTHSSPLSNILVEQKNETQIASAEQSADRQVFETHQGTEKETPSTMGSRSSDINAILHCSPSSFESLQTDAAKCQTDKRKTLPRSSKGCGRVCTACPCGTKVGGVSVNSVSKQHEKPNTTFFIESKKDVIEFDRLSDLCCTSTHSKSASTKAGDKMTHGGQLHVDKNVKVAVPTASSSTCQTEAQPTVTKTFNSSSRCTQDETYDKTTSNRSIQKTNLQAEGDMISSSSPQLYYTSYKIPNKLYSSVLMDSEEIKRQERIRRLKDLLEEKEVALEKLRKSMW